VWKVFGYVQDIRERLFSGSTQARKYRFRLFITQDILISNPAAGIERRDMGERRPFTLALAVMLCVFYVYVASECYEGHLIADTNSIGLYVRQTLNDAESIKYLL
jgi:hypothetical protein